MTGLVLICIGNPQCTASTLGQFNVVGFFSILSFFLYIESNRVWDQAMENWEHWLLGKLGTFFVYF